MTNASIATTTAAAPAAIGARRGRRHRRMAEPGGTAIPAAPAAAVTPHPGHGPPARAQQRSHANTPQDGHIDSLIRDSLATGPIRLPQRSQNGRGAPRRGSWVRGEIMQNGVQSPPPPGSAGCDVPRGWPIRPLRPCSLPTVGPPQRPPDNPTPVDTAR